jgi:hypothetical protein
MENYIWETQEDKIEIILGAQTNVALGATLVKSSKNRKSLYRSERGGTMFKFRPWSKWRHASSNHNQPRTDIGGRCAGKFAVELQIDRKTLLQ